MKQTLSIAALSGMLCVALGAFGAHGLKKVLSPEMLTVFETGVRYQFYHTFALIAVAVLMHFQSSLKLQRAAYFFYTGIVLFSGSLYMLAVTSISGANYHWIGMITPIGGVCFIIGWVYLLLAARAIKE